MVPLMSLIAPIVLAGIIVFLASFLVHMVLGYHKGDFKTLPAEDDVMAALQKFSLPPGDYMVPRPASMEAMKSAEFKAKREKGPVMLATVIKPGPVTMGPQLLKWFLFCCVV